MHEKYTLHTHVYVHRVHTYEHKYTHVYMPKLHTHVHSYSVHTDMHTYIEFHICIHNRQTYSQYIDSMQHLQAPNHLNLLDACNAFQLSVLTLE